MNILVFGGAGFIGSHLSDGLLAAGHKVTVFDCLDAQVHGEGLHASGKPPGYLNSKVNFIKGDVQDRNSIKQALKGIDAVYFFAAAVGVGQSMYEISRYVSVNSLGGANFLDVIVNEKHGVQKIVVASSMSVYGEGLYQNASGEIKRPILRTAEQLADKQWEHRDSDGSELKPIPTPEDKPMNPTSVYAVTKRDHEELFLSVGLGYGIPVVALRFFNVYGTRQALSNPYTGVAAIFSSLILNGRAPKVFEDGLQTRDFVHVSDIVQANIKVLENSNADGEVFNVGSGSPINIRDLGALLLKKLGREDIQPEIAEKFRVGDIRHCFADISKARELIGYEPQVKMENGVDDLTAWVKEQTAQDAVDQCTEELSKHKLIW